MPAQYSKTIRDIPAPYIAISMGYGVTCPYIGRTFDDDWGLYNPTGHHQVPLLAVHEGEPEGLLCLHQQGGSVLPGGDCGQGCVH
jgi:arsenate reductase